MQEVWRPVPISGYERVYRVSNLGRVMRVADQRILKSNSKKNRYWAVRLKRFPDDKPLFCQIHRLVAMAFLGNQANLVVHHKDHNRYNNHVSNLEWVTQAQNLAYSRKEGRLHSKRCNGKFVAETVHKKFESPKSD